MKAELRGIALATAERIDSRGLSAAGGTPI
jgi:hypothetical protein